MTLFCLIGNKTLRGCTHCAEEGCYRNCTMERKADQVPHDIKTMAKQLSIFSF